MQTIDLRSDTLTRPTEAMRRAMADAEVGDDVYGEDPTVRELEALAAGRTGKEAAVFVPSGTMANQIAIWVHTRRQGQVILDANTHMSLYESGAAGLLSGATMRTVETPRGHFGPDDIRPHLLPDDPHFLPTRLVCAENTHSWSGGTVWDPDTMIALAGAAKAHGAAFHIDGARLWNAAVAQGAPATAWTECADSVMFCVSKGLSAPVGSLLCGSEAFVEEARRVRKALGGGMRQAGVIAAAGVVALRTMVDRLADDHAHARTLAEGLFAIDGLDVDLSSVQTNIVNADVAATGLMAADFCALAKDVGVLCLPRFTDSVVRFVTQRHVSADDVVEAVRRLRAVLEDRPLT